MERWTIHKAAQEFDVHRETLGKRLNSQGIKSEDGLFSVIDCCKAIYGDLDGEKLLLTREQRIKLERENAREEKQLIPADLVERVWSATCIEYRQRVLNSEIPKQLKDELLEILTEAKIDEYFAAALKAMESDPDKVADPA